VNNIEFINKPRQSGKSRLIDSKIKENLRDNKKVLLIDHYARRPEPWHKDVNFELSKTNYTLDVRKTYDYIYIDEYMNNLDEIIDMIECSPSTTHITCIGTPHGKLSKKSLEFLKMYCPEQLFEI